MQDPTNPNNDNKRLNQDKIERTKEKTPGMGIMTILFIILVVGIGVYYFYKENAKHVPTTTPTTTTPAPTNTVPTNTAPTNTAPTNTAPTNTAPTNTETTNTTTTTY